MHMQSRLEEYRAMRRELEHAILPIGTSIDGRSFTFQCSLHGLALQVGGYVTIETGRGRALGQVLELAAKAVDVAQVELARDDDLSGRATMQIRLAQGAGALLEGDGEPFHDASLRPAEPAEVAAWLERRASSRARLDIGELALAPGVPLALDAGGFDRHTFLCGQSGSGKTYSLGVMLERLLLETRLRMVILDPNSDYVRMGELRHDVAGDVAARYGEAVAGLAVHRSHGAGEERLRLRLGELEPAAQAALLQLDPIADRDEYAELASVLADERPPSLEAFQESQHPAAMRLVTRMRNLGADTMGIWARTDAGTSIDAVHDQSLRGLVVDLGSLGTRAEQSLTAAAVLGSLWSRREERRPVLIVIDEAHNVCPAEPEDGLTALATDHAVRIAAEGRKFGLYLFVSTQRPQKVHPNVVTQADNLVLMRLNSAADAAYAQDVFSFAPAGLLARAPTLRLGEALVAGKIAPAATLVRFGRRIAQEGGADVPADWAAPA
jgi:uncharacterized protein